MGVAITDLLVFHEKELDFFRDRVIAVDASMWIHQFLSSIRSVDGTPLKDEKGRVTSHLVGFLGRVPRLMNSGLRLCFVFDGKPPKLKTEERARRRAVKEEAKAKYEIAVQAGDLAEMRKYASRTSSITSEIVAESKEIISALGLPYVQAPSEAEAQCATMVSAGDAYAVATNDADALLFGAPRVIRNLSLVGKRKKTSKLAFETIKPQYGELKETLGSLGFDQKQLIALGMLVGTDYNYGG